jgi:hypothetical protein
MAAACRASMPPFADTGDEQRHLLRLRFEPVHHGQRLLHLITDDVTPELVAGGRSTRGASMFVFTPNLSFVLNSNHG